MIVAHPDDETIWLGGTLLRYVKINWTIFSLCRRADPDRYPKFLRVCKFYQVQPLISDLDDEDILTVEESIPEIKERLNRLIKAKKFDYIFTHGANGEYGHPRHVGVHRAVKALIKEKKLAARQVFYFCYSGRNRGDGSQAINRFTKAKYSFKLTKDEFDQKRTVINNFYGFKKNSFEYLSCLKQETFY